MCIFNTLPGFLDNRMPQIKIYTSNLNKPVFRQELENRKNEAVNQAVDRLKATASKACDTLIGLLDHAESESVRHRVAIDLLNMTLKYIEFKDVEQRIRKLEDTITE